MIDESQESTSKIAPSMLQRCYLARASSYDRRSVAEVVQSSQTPWDGEVRGVVTVHCLKREGQ